MTFLPQFLVMAHLCLPDPLTWRTMTGESMTFHPWSIILYSCSSSVFINPWTWWDSPSECWRTYKHWCCASLNHLLKIVRVWGGLCWLAWTWRLASITAIYKKSIGEEPGNYRPVNLTSVPGKVTEKIVLGDTGSQLMNKAIVSHSQCGLMKGQSCRNNFISFSNKVTCFMSGEKAVDVIFLYFK